MEKTAMFRQDRLGTASHSEEASSLTGKKSDHTAFSSVSSVVWISFPRYGKQIVDIRISPNITKSWATLMAVSCKKTHHLFLSAFPMFVPSLSWSK
jgi:hypothetical protein